MDGVRGVKSLLNGFAAWGLGFALYLIPALAIAFGMTFDLGRQGQDPASISAQIGRRIPVVYAGNRLLMVWLIVATAIMVLWRTYTLAGDTRSTAVIHGLIIASVSTALTILMLLGFGSLGWPSALAGVAYAAAGVAGGALAGGRGAGKA